MIDIEFLFLAIIIYWLLVIAASSLVADIKTDDTIDRAFKIAFVLFAFVSVPLFFICLPFSTFFKNK